MPDSSSTIQDRWLLAHALPPPTGVGGKQMVNVVPAPARSRPDTAAVRLDRALHDREAEARCRPAARHERLEEALLNSSGMPGPLSVTCSRSGVLDVGAARQFTGRQHADPDRDHAHGCPRAPARR